MLIKHDIWPTYFEWWLMSESRLGRNQWRPSTRAAGTCFSLPSSGSLWRTATSSENCTRNLGLLNTSSSNAILKQETEDCSFAGQRRGSVTGSLPRARLLWNVGNWILLFERVTICGRDYLSLLKVFSLSNQYFPAKNTILKHSCVQIRSMRPFHVHRTAPEHNWTCFTCINPLRTQLCPKFCS